MYRYHTSITSRSSLGLHLLAPTKNVGIKITNRSPPYAVRNKLGWLSGPFVSVTKQVSAAVQVMSGLTTVAWWSGRVIG